MEFGRPTRAVEEEEKEEEVARDAERTPPPEYEPGRERQTEEGGAQGDSPKNSPGDQDFQAESAQKVPRRRLRRPFYGECVGKITGNHLKHNPPR